MNNDENDVTPPPPPHPEDQVHAISVGHHVRVPDTSHIFTVTDVTVSVDRTLGGVTIELTIRGEHQTYSTMADG